MKRVDNKIADYLLEGGAYLDVKVGKDINGNYVISELRIHFDSTKKAASLPNGGITAKTLRDIKFEMILQDEFQKSPITTLSENDRKRLLKYLLQGVGSTGRTGYPDEYYAALSYFYLKHFEESPFDCTAKLAGFLDLPKRTVINRLATARRMGMLTPLSTEKPSGRAGGSLTPKAEQVISAFLKN